MKKPNIKQLTADRKFDAQRIAAYCAEIGRLNNEKATLLLRQTSRELELKATVVESAAHLIEALCKMVGGPGF